MSTALELSSAFNFRDLGGYAGTGGRAVRRGAVYRADGLSRIDPAELAVLAGAGLRTVLDLRTVQELETAPSVEHEALDVFHLPVIERTWTMEEMGALDDGDPVAFLAARYMVMLEEGRAAFATSFELLADPGRRPAVFHCSAGKDRTGVLAALLLSVLGVDDATIAADYHRSAAGMERMLDWIRANRPEVADAMVNQRANLLACPPEAMHSFLAELRGRYESPERYLRTECGVGAPTLAALRDGLLG